MSCVPLCARPPRSRGARYRPAHSRSLIHLLRTCGLLHRGNVAGLQVYRELVNRELRSVAQWERQYGKAALLRQPDPREMQNLGKFEKFASMPMPLEVQLKMLQQQRKKQAAEIAEFERKTFPTHATYPVSALSV